MRRVRAGQLRNQITIQSNTDSRDAYGGVTSSWSTHVQAWASINPISGTERQGDSKITGDLTYEFIFRHDPSVARILTGMRISWDSRIFDIEQVMEWQERAWWIRLIATEREV